MTKWGHTQVNLTPKGHKWLDALVVILTIVISWAIVIAAIVHYNSTHDTKDDSGTIPPVSYACHDKDKECGP